MAAKYDLEVLMSDIQTIMANNLNTKITAINAEKADSISLTTVDSDSYFFQTMDETTVNKNPFVYYGINEIETDGIGPVVAKNITIGVIIVYADTHQDLLIANYMLRYLRALEETFTDNWNETQSRAKLRVESFAPFQFEGVNTSNMHRAAAVALRLTMP